MDYESFLKSKERLSGNYGFEPSGMNDNLFPFQKFITEWAIRKGRAGIFADCGLGKTIMELEWGTEVARHCGKPVLFATPLAVSHQVLRESQKFGIDGVERNQTGAVTSGNLITVTNYERLHLFNPDDFCGMIADESSILKNFDGVRRAEITEFMRTLPYRLLCTATAAPNDFIELGTSSEALGEMGYIDMLTRFFTNRQMSIDQRNRTRFAESADGWRLKGHAAHDFWRWVCSWALACRKPSDIGFDDDRFHLPELIEKEHFVKAQTVRDGWLFDTAAVNLHEERETYRRTIQERCEMVASLVDHSGQALIWCNLNDEGDTLASMIPGAEQISGSDSDETKESRLLAFANGDLQRLITKPKIGAWGLNLQNCCHMTFFPTHSYEQYYQGVRRCWRFGQKNPVKVDIIAVDGVRNVMENLQRKANQADEMFSKLVKYMNDSLSIENDERFNVKEEVPSWL